MNERLKQIILESGTHKHISAECQHRIEMVAELIVRECIEIARTVGGDSGVEMEMIIRNDFGVEG